MSEPIQKVGMIVQVSKEMLADHVGWQSAMLNMFRPDNRTPEQREADRAVMLARFAETRQRIEAEHATVLAAAHPLVLPILELHGPVFGEAGYDNTAYCEGCDVDGYEAEQPGFPCRTYDLASGKGVG